jgi:hypothetical protein
MWDIVYYLAGVGMIGTVGYGLLYILDRDTADDIAQQVSWNAVKAYHKAELEYNNVKRWYETNSRERLDRSDDENDFEDEEKHKSEYQFLGYNLNDDTTYTSSVLLNNNYIDDNDFDLMFLMKKEGTINIYKRILNKTNINENVNMKKIEKPFIQVELCQNEEKKSIHKHLENFYLEDNMLLDNSFLIWYVKTFYGAILEDDYELSIIDSDINMFKINKDQHIILNQNKKYNLIGKE